MAETYTGQVQNGAVILDEGTPPLPEGARLRIELVAEEGDQRRRSLADRLASVTGRAEGLPADLADQHDHYLHGQPMR